MYSVGLRPVTLRRPSRPVHIILRNGIFQAVIFHGGGFFAAGPVHLIGAALAANAGIRPGVGFQAVDLILELALAHSLDAGQDQVGNEVRRLLHVSNGNGRQFRLSDKRGGSGHGLCSFRGGSGFGGQGQRARREQVVDDFAAALAAVRAKPIMR